MKLSLLTLAPVVLLAVAGCAKAYGDAEQERTEAAITEPPPAPKKEKKPAVTSETSANETIAPATPSHDANGDAKAAAPSAPTTLDFAWHEVSPTAEYSLDVMLTNGELVGPCIGAPVLGRDLTLEAFTGKCTSAERTFPLADIVDFRICYAEDDDWANCDCKLANWDGKTSSIVFDN